MLGNSFNYDNKKDEKFPILKVQYDPELKRFLHLVLGKEVLDLGVGQGSNSIPLFKQGYNITGVDCSAKCLHICEENCPGLNLIQSDIRNFEIEKNKYDLILSRYVLHFLHKDESYKIIENVKKNIKKSGLIFISVFSTEDFRIKKFSSNPNFEELENHIFHNKINDTYISFFTKEEIKNLFKDFKPLLVEELYSLDERQENTSYSGVIKYIGQKI